ncbi:MAG: SulP family inorganic anion transporter, partial [Planctomycetaceae bacterium]|nr:SulP family inorganic anion transporter [Planctomycetaceae bacterium]
MAEGAPGAGEGGGAGGSAEAPPSRLPVFRWLSGYAPSSFPRDAVAGLVLATYLVPISIAYSSLAGLPPQAGLYSSMLAGIAFAAFTSGRHTSIAITSAISLLVGSVLGQMADGDVDRQMALASLTALYVGVVGLCATALKAGGVVAFISETILAGFKIGVAIHITVSQLPKLLGVKVAGSHVLDKAFSLLTKVDETHLPSLLLGGGALLLIFLGDRLLRNKPWALLAMAISIAAVSFTGLGERGIKVLGDIPAGLPRFGPPGLGFKEVDGLLGLALACFLLASVETMAVARTFATKHGYRVDTNREFLAIGAANLLVGVGQGYPVSGGMSQSAVNESAGARTPMSLVVACVLLGLVTLYLGGLFRNLPDPVLAAVVLMAIRGLFDFRLLRSLRKFSRFEFTVALIALGGVVVFGVLKGVLLAVVASLLLLLRRAANPPIVVLGRKPGTPEFPALDRDPTALRLPGVLLVRVYGGLVYFNTDDVRERLAAIWRAEGEPRLVVLDLDAVPLVDMAGARLIGDFRAELAAKGQVTGQLKTLKVKAGDSVKKGQLLAEIDPIIFQA